MRRWLLASVFTVTTSSYGIMFFSSYCFSEFQLATDKISDMCFYTQVGSCNKSFIKPAGVAALAFVCFGIFGWRRFACWTRAEVERDRNGKSRKRAAQQPTSGTQGSSSLPSGVGPQTENV